MAEKTDQQDMDWLVKQLLAQIDQDEKAVVDLTVHGASFRELPISRRAVHELVWNAPDPVEAARRWLAECAAKRSIVDEYQRVRSLFDPLDVKVQAGDSLPSKDRIEWGRHRLVLEGLGYAVRALAEAANPET